MAFILLKMLMLIFGISGDQFSFGGLIEHTDGFYKGYRQETFIYDAADNLLNDNGKDHKKPILNNRIEDYQAAHYEYDAFGNTILRKINSDQQKLIYNQENQLIRVTCESSRGVDSVDYEYDALGRRIKKTVHNQYNYDDKQTTFLWMGMQMVQEDCGSVEFPHKYTYIYQADGSYEPLAQIYQSHAVDNPDHTRILYYQTAQNGNPERLYTADGEIKWQENHTVLGVANHAFLYHQPEKVHQPLRFQGQYFDQETSLHYNTFRYYDPHVGRFITQDPIGLNGGINLYQYAPNPLMWIDPWGWAGNPANATHITYEGIKHGKPYIGYASKPGLGHSPSDVLDYRYSNNYSEFSQRPIPMYRGDGQAGKDTARGLEQRVFEDRGGLEGTSNKKNPVGENNASRDRYLAAADEHRANKNSSNC